MSRFLSSLIFTSNTCWSELFQFQKQNHLTAKLGSFMVDSSIGFFFVNLPYYDTLFVDNYVVYWDIFKFFSDENQLKYLLFHNLELFDEKQTIIACHKIFCIFWHFKTCGLANATTKQACTNNIYTCTSSVFKVGHLGWDILNRNDKGHKRLSIYAEALF